MNDAGELSAPAVYDGVLYAINASGPSAIDVRRPADLAHARWRPSPASRASRSMARSPAAGRRSTTASSTGWNIGQLRVALDMKTARSLETEFADSQGYYATGRDRGKRRADLGHGRRRIHHT